MKQDFNEMNLDNEEIEIKLLLEGIKLKYGYDFVGYSKGHIKRRVSKRLAASGLGTPLELIPHVLYDRSFFEKLLLDFSINVTEMFRDPTFYKVLRQEIIPILKTYPFVKIWHAGCATGEEVYSMAILLKEEGLYDRAQIYATDFNQRALEQAKEGIYPIDIIKGYTYNYQQSGGIGSFADYYMVKHDSVIIDPSLKKKVIFADHNLVTDGVFGEMHMVVCRNVLIYFGRDLQSRVIKLFHESLLSGGFLCLGSKESIKFSSSAYKFQSVDEDERIYQKKFFL